MNDQIKQEIISLIKLLIDEWELEIENEITPHTQLIKDLGFSSIDFVELFVRIENQFQQKFGFHQLIMIGDKYIDDLSLKQLISFIEKNEHISIELNPENTQKSISNNVDSCQKLTLENLEEFRKKIPEPIFVNQINQTKNPPAVFILSPSRSGSTLFRVILAGNPQIFAPPELHLLSFDTLKNRDKALNNQENRHLLDGTIKSIITAKKCPIEEAEKIMNDLLEKNLSTQDFYSLLQVWLKDKILVDKTPSYSYHLNFLKRAEMQFENAFYIHLTRHPYGMIRSFEDAKMDKLLPFMDSQEFSRRQYGELAWLVCHQNIMTFLQNIPSHRQIKIQFEDLVTMPEIIIKKICAFLKVDFSAEMLNPYQYKQEKMTDGLKNYSRMSGDLKFHLHRQIEPSIAYRWRKYHQIDFLSDFTWEIAQSFGYDPERLN